MYYFIECLRALAVALITNSHFKGVYFTGWKSMDFLAFGGGNGVAIFFMITGYLLGQIKPNTSFKKWYRKKIMMMYFPFLMFSALEFFLRLIGMVAEGINKSLDNGNLIIYTGLQMIEHMEIEDWISVLLPLNYWFVYAMAILYIVYYFYENKIANRVKRGVLVTELTLIVVFLIWYILLDKSKGEVLLNPNPIMQITWFGCMLIGMQIRKNIADVNHNRKPMVWIALSIGCLIVFLFVKICILKNNMQLQILLPVTYIGFAYGCFRLFMSFEDSCKKLLTSESGISKFVGRSINMISTASVEIYYVQFMWIRLLKDIVFPFNWAILVVCIVVSAHMLHLFSVFMLNKASIQ